MVKQLSLGTVVHWVLGTLMQAWAGTLLHWVLGTLKHCSTVWA